MPDHYFDPEVADLVGEDESEAVSPDMASQEVSQADAERARPDAVVVVPEVTRAEMEAKFEVEVAKGRKNERK